MFTKTGYMNKYAWASLVTDFASLWNALHPGLEVLLFVDQLESHMQASIVAKANIASVRFVFYPAELTHVLQPLDGLPFALLKRALLHEKAALDFAASVRGQPARGNVLDAAYEVEDRALSRASLVHEFRARGSWPFVATTILARVHQAVRRPHRTPSSFSDAVMGSAVAAASGVLAALQPRRRALRRASVKHNVVYSDRELLELDARREAEKLEKKASVQDAAERRKRRAATRKEKEKARRAAVASRWRATVAGARKRDAEKVRCGCGVGVGGGAGFVSPGLRGRARARRRKFE
jgi:hypothetical protein